MQATAFEASGTPEGVQLPAVSQLPPLGPVNVRTLVAAEVQTAGKAPLAVCGAATTTIPDATSAASAALSIDRSMRPHLCPPAPRAPREA